MKIICVVGMPGSGKGVAVKVFRDYGLSIVNMGDVIREEARTRGYEVTPANLGRVSLALREEYGDEEIAKRCLGKIIKELSSGRDVVIEGIRSLKEIVYFKRRFRGDFYTLAIHSKPKVRFNRLKARGRGDDPEDWEEFEERDRRELGYGMGSAIALAEYMIVNEGTLEELKGKIEDVYREITQ